MILYLTDKNTFGDIFCCSVANHPFSLIIDNKKRLEKSVAARNRGVTRASHPEPCKRDRPKGNLLPRSIGREISWLLTNRPFPVWGARSDRNRFSKSTSCSAYCTIEEWLSTPGRTTKRYISLVLANIRRKIPKPRPSDLVWQNRLTKHSCFHSVRVAKQAMS